MRGVIGFAILALLLAGLAPKLAVSLRPHAVPMPRQPPSVETADSYRPRSISIPRDAHGNFQVGGEVDGRRIDFIVDTGASFVALPEREAVRLGYHPGARDYTWPIQTANGVGRAAKVSLDTVEVGGVVVRDVDAFVLSDEALTTSLLGLSFLSRLHRFEYSDGRLVLEE